MFTNERAHYIAGVLRVFTNERAHYSRRADGCLLLSVYTIAGELWVFAGLTECRSARRLGRQQVLGPGRSQSSSAFHRLATTLEEPTLPVTQHMHCTPRTPLAFQQRIRTPHYSPCATQILSCYLLTSFVVIFANSKRCICQAAAGQKRCCWCFACPATPESIAGQHK